MPPFLKNPQKAVRLITLVTLAFITFMGAALVLFSDQTFLGG